MPSRTAWASRICFTALGCATGAALAQGAAPCFDEFVQELEVDDAGGMLRDVRPCNTGELGGPPPFPRSTVKIRIEYSGGDHYTEQVRRRWDVVPDGAGCVNAVLRVERLVHLRVGGRNESVRELQGRVERSRDSGAEHGSLFLEGAIAKSRSPGANAPNTHVEGTPYGLDCVRYQPPVLAGMPPGTACWVLTAPRCPAALWLAPIELRTPLSPNHSLTQRTTALRTGAVGQVVDRGHWVLP
jgi:hypothetical protein